VFSPEQVLDALAVAFAFNLTDRLASAFDFEVLDKEGFDAGAKYLLKRVTADRCTETIGTGYGNARCPHGLDTVQVEDHPRRRGVVLSSRSPVSVRPRTLG